MELFNKTAHELHAMLVNKEISAVEITKDVISRMEATDDKVKAYITKTAEYALAQAANVDADIAGGPDAPAEALEEHDERNQKENEKDNRQNLRALAFFTRRHNYLLLRKERESKFFLHLYFLTHETTCHLLFQAPESEVSLPLY